MKDTYKTLKAATEESLFKEKGSKFFGYAFPITKEEEIRVILSRLKKQHPSAGHFCYAWQLGKESIRFRVSDDGEPNNSAGMPLYGQIQTHALTDVLVVSVRYFGGTKLGVGGLIQAYKHSAQQTLEKASVVTRTIDVVYQLTFEYELMNAVMRIVKEKNLTILSQDLGEQCVSRIAIRKSDAKTLLERFKSLYKIKIQEED